MDEEDRNRLVLRGGDANPGAYCGLASAPSLHGWSYSAAYIGSRLAVKSNEIAIYFGEQFFWSHRFKRYGKGRFNAASPV